MDYPADAVELARVRGKVNKVVRAEIARLEDMLVATLERTPPKLHITKTYGDEVLDNLKKLLDDIQ